MGKKPAKKGGGGKVITFCTTSVPSKAKEQDAEAEAEAAAAGAPEGAGGGPAFEPPPRAAEGSAGAAAGEDTGWEAVAEAAEDGADVAELLGMGAAASAPAAPSASQAEGGASKESVEEEVARRVREEFEREEKREAGPSNCARMLKASANRVRESATGKIALPAPLEAKILDLMQSDSASEAATEDCVRPLSEPIFFDGEQLRVFSMLRYPPTYRLKVNSATRAYDRLYESHKLLESHGFAPEHVRAALEATLGLDLRAALEWLVLTLPPGAVPTPLGGEGGEAIKLYEGGKSKKPSKAAAGRGGGGRPPREPAAAAAAGGGAAEPEAVAGAPAEGAEEGAEGGKDGEGGEECAEGAEEPDASLEECAAGAEEPDAPQEEGEAADDSCDEDDGDRAVPSATPAAAAPPSKQGDTAPAKAAEGGAGSFCEGGASGSDAKVEPAKDSKSSKAAAKDFNKQWLAQYCYDDDDASDGGGLEDEAVARERRKKADPMAFYREISIEFTKLKRRADKIRDQKKSTMGRKLGDLMTEANQVNLQMKRIKAEMEEMESGKYGKLDTAGKSGRPDGVAALDRKPRPPKRAAAASAEDVPAEGDAAGGEEDGAVDLFGEEADKLVVLEELDESDPTGKVCRDYAIGRSWTGKKPKEILDEFVRKSLRLGQKAIKYDRLPRVGARGERARCTVLVKEPVRAEPVEGCASAEEAGQLSATLALFELCAVRNLSTRTVSSLLPPAHREFWRDRADELKAKQREEQQKQLRPRVEFCARLSRQLEEEGFFSLKGRADRPAEAGKGAGKGAEGAVRLRIPAPSVNLEERQAQLADDPAFSKITAARRELPVWAMRHELINAIDFHDVVIVQGATGSGKTTQLPQFVLEAALARGEPVNILVTEPRRLSAMTVARRVSQELGDPGKGPGGHDSLTGFHIRMEKSAGPSCRLLFCTTGVALRKMQSEPDLPELTHVFLDEVHERGAESDLLLLLLRRLLSTRRKGTLKVVLMSATVDTRKMSNYFQSAGVAAPVLCVPGRAYDVEALFLEDIIEKTGFYLEEDSEFRKWQSRTKTVKQTFTMSALGGKSKTETAYMEEQGAPLDGSDAEWIDEEEAAGYSRSTQEVLLSMDHSKLNYDLLVATLEFIVSGGLPPADSGAEGESFMPAQDGAILVFLPGIAEIDKAEKALTHHPEFCNSYQYKIIVLHSSIASEDTNAAFEPAPRGARKIVLSTNIAETGVTIPDVVYVVDAGRVKQSKFHEATNTSSLTDQFISRAEGIQRRGRAGRVRPGVCVHLFTRKRFERFSAAPLPELLRTALSELMLGLLSRGMPPAIFYEALDPPPRARVEQALQSLRVAGALAPPGLRDAGGAGGEVDVDGQDVVYRVRPLGRILARLPCEVRIGKMLIYGALLGGGPFEDVLTVAATLSNGKSPLVVPFQDYKKAEARAAQKPLFNDKEPSDHAMICEAYRMWLQAKKNGAAERICKQHWLAAGTMEQIHRLRKDLSESLKDLGIVSDRPKPLPQRWAISSALLLAGLFPNVCRVDPPRVATENRPQYVAAFTNEHVKLHPSSFAHSHDNHLHQTALRWGVFHAKVQTSAVFMRDVTFLRPLALALLGGTSTDMHCHVLERAVSVGGKGDLAVNVPPRHGALLRQLRELVEQAVDRAVENAERAGRTGRRGGGGGGSGDGGAQEEGGAAARDREAAARQRQALDIMEELLTAEATTNR